MRPRLGDNHVDEALQQPGRAGEIDPAIVLGAPGEIPLALLRPALDQHALHAADHRGTDDQSLCIEQRLQPAQALLLDLERHYIGQRGGGRAGPAAVEKTERLVESDLGHELERRLEIALALAREANDDIGRYRAVG